MRDKNHAKVLAAKEIAKLTKLKNQIDSTEKKQVCQNAVGFIQTIVATKLA